jgi:16S rRNA (cytosine967-C5)-methyltransferase
VYDGPPLARLIGLAADAVMAVRSGRSATEALERLPAEVRPGVQALTFQTLRRLGGARAVVRQLASRAPPPPVEALLTTAVALLWPSPAPPYPDHTLVDQAVTAACQHSPAAAGFVNALLRRFVRERAALAAAVRRSPEAAWNYPVWWIERVRADWPGQWEAILAAADGRPPMTLRVNARRCTAQAYVERLVACGRAARTLDAPALGGHAVELAEPCAVADLPGFTEGDVSVQDANAQRAAPLLLHGGAALPAGARVLDACAAPGGKTAHLLELADLDLLALDSEPARLELVQGTLDRLCLKASLRAADARAVQTWWDGRAFDAILLDAPCTASGIVRRHPDVRWLRRPQDIDALARIQAELLDALWPLVAPGGRLLFATCSIFRAEGERQIDAFLQRLPAGAARLDPASPGHLLPLPDNGAGGTHGTSPQGGDGFFYALLHKT